MIKSVRLIESEGLDPYENLALEECLLKTLKTGELIFYLWRNDRTVVIGRNQNCLRECDVNSLEADGGFLARRVSGGGAVYHDAGNLNFSFITSRGDYDERPQNDAIIAAVKSLGVDAERSGRNDFTAAGRKFSGNAYYHGANSLRHGTILVAADVKKLGAYLNAPGGKLETKGIRSVASAVVNLSELNNKIGIVETKAALIRAVADSYAAPVTRIEKDEVDRAEYEACHAKHRSPEWKYGDAPDGGYRISGRFAWGGAEIFLTLNGGVVERCRVYTDALETAPAELLPGALNGVRFTGAELSRAAEKVLEPFAEIRRDIANLLLESCPRGGVLL